MKQKKQIVVIGGGFAGMNFAKRIDKLQYDVVLVDRNNFHSFPPLFYQIASSGLQPDSICFPFRREFSRGKAKGVRFHIGEVERIDTAKRTVVTQYEEIPYDILVIAAGTTNNFFGNPSLVDSVYTLKSAAQAMRCRDEILDRLERASLEPDATKRREMLTFTVVGGGPAGVEIAGSLGEMKSYILNRNYPDINKDDVSITLMEGSGALLGAMSEKAQQCALQYLEELNVKVELHTILKGLDGDMATLGDDSTRFAGMVIWTAGVMAPDITFDGMSVERGHGNRILVDEYNRVRNQSQPIYVLGDMALMTTEEYPHGHPQLAQVAIQQGQLLARNLNNSDKQTAFKYHDKGTMATVGRGRAVADIGRFHYSGFMAWIVWMGVHLLSLLGMRNKINVFIDWIWGYF
ncbi:MAG: NAD(P)/FAD-dependent oxidoreductase, partial [Paramuribaculum sp.]|nr:NAD(P)/FAD-dependent oxidoreductase [Paramuribaculum sp.]